MQHNQLEASAYTSFSLLSHILFPAERSETSGDLRVAPSERQLQLLCSFQLILLLTAVDILLGALHLDYSWGHTYSYSLADDRI